MSTETMQEKSTIICDSPLGRTAEVLAHTKLPVLVVR